MLGFHQHWLIYCNIMIRKAGLWAKYNESGIYGPLFALFLLIYRQQGVNRGSLHSFALRSLTDSSSPAWTKRYFTLIQMLE